MNSHGTSGPCHRCGHGGHLARECSLHVCFRCNGRGRMAWECLEGVTRSRCGEKGHLQCNCKNISCHKCGRKGHIFKFCNDPFAKAEEVDRNEPQQTLLKSRIVLDQGNAKDWVTPTVRVVRSQKFSGGPWDGLGDPGLDKTLLETQAPGVGVALGKPGANRSQNSSMGNVKILNVRQLLYPEASLNRMKRRRLHNCGDLVANICASGAGIRSSKYTSKVEEPIPWNALLDYGHEDNREECDVSNDRNTMDQNCDPKEHVQLHLIANVDDTSDSFADHRNGALTGLQSSLQQEQTFINKRNDSALATTVTTLQSS